jgi:hypothetical protein
MLVPQHWSMRQNIVENIFTLRIMVVNFTQLRREKNV